MKMTLLAAIACVGMVGAAWGDWSDTGPTNSGTSPTGPGVVVWRAHLAAVGTNAHSGLIASNQIGSGLGWVGGYLVATGGAVSAVAFSAITGDPTDNAALGAWGATLGGTDTTARLQNIATTNALAALRAVAATGDFVRAETDSAALAANLATTNALNDLRGRALTNAEEFVAAVDFNSFSQTVFYMSMMPAQSNAITDGLEAWAALQFEPLGSVASLSNSVFSQGYGTGAGGDFGTTTVFQVVSNRAAGSVPYTNATGNVYLGNNYLYAWRMLLSGNFLYFDDAATYMKYDQQGQWFSFTHDVKTDGNFLGDGSLLTGVLTNGGATVNNMALTNGAALVIAFQPTGNYAAVQGGLHPYVYTVSISGRVVVVTEIMKGSNVEVTAISSTNPASYNGPPLGTVFTNPVWVAGPDRWVWDMAAAGGTNFELSVGSQTGFWESHTSVAVNREIPVPNIAGTFSGSGAFPVTTDGNAPDAVGWMTLDYVAVSTNIMTFDLSDRGATNIIAGSADSYNASTRTLTWNTNAVPAGSGEADGGATNIAAGATDSYDPATRRLTWNTNAVPVGTGSGAGDNLGSHVAVSNLYMDGYTVDFATNTPIRYKGAGVTNSETMQSTQKVFTIGGVNIYLRPQ